MILSTAQNSLTWNLAAKRITGSWLSRQARQELACRLILCQLFAQDLPNLRWGLFNNFEVNSMNTLQVTVL